MTRLVDVIRLIRAQPNFLGLLATNMFLGLSNAFTVPFLSLWGTQHLGLSSAWYGAFMIIVGLSGVVISLALSRWSDSGTSRRTVLLLGASGGIIGYFGYAFVTNIVALTAIGSFALGVSTVCFSQLFAHVREEIDRSDAARPHAPFLLSVQRVFFSLAWAIGPGTAAIILGEYDYRGMFMAAGLLCVCLLVCVLIFVPRREHSAAALEAAKVPLSRVLRRFDIAIYFLGLTLFFAAMTLLDTTLPLMVVGEMGGSEKAVGLLIGIRPAIELPLFLWAGRLASRGHTLNLIRVGIGSCILYALLLPFAQSPWQAAPLMVLGAIAMATNTNITITFFQDLLPNQAGIATNIFGNSYTIGSLAGFLVFLFRDALGNPRLCFVCGGIALLSLAAFYVRRPQAEPEEVNPTALSLASLKED